MDARQAALIDRIDRKLAQRGLNDFAASMLAVGKPDLIRDLRRKKTLPRSDRLQSLAEVLETTAEWLLTGEGEEDARGESDPRRSVRDPLAAFNRFERPRDVPVRGTPSCGDIEVDGKHVETVEMDLGEVVDYVRRPPSLEGRKDVYAIYFTGFSMEPRYEAGEVAYVDPRRPPAIGDYVVVQLKHQRGEEEDPRIVSALVKRLARRSADWIELEQFNPAMIFRVPQKRVHSIHRIIPWGELVGF